MDRKTNRVISVIVACSAAGVLLGGASSWADSRQCLRTSTPTSECLTQNPVTKTIQGMSFGLLAGAGAAVGATWQLRKQEN